VTFAEELARRGADLVLIARSKDALQAVAARLTAQYGVKCYVIAADLADPKTIDDIHAELAEHGLPVDLLINNAGLGLSGGFLDHDHAKEQASIQVNVQALVGLSHRFGKAMAARGRGGIINIASNSAFQPLPYMATYAASKAFVLHFGEALQHELSDTGVRVMTACPGPTATSFFEGTPTTMSDRSFDTPESVVRGILRAFDQGKAVAYPGRLSVRFATWLPRLLPRSLIVRLAGRPSSIEQVGQCPRPGRSPPSSPQKPDRPPIRPACTPSTQHLRDFADGAIGGQFYERDPPGREPCTLRD
jgi:short-subunit dehydrogenase